MIRFESKGEKVIARIDTGVKVEKNVWLFDWSLPNEVIAVVMAEHFQKRLDAAIEGIRREAYNAGLADAKAKRAKKTKFWNAFEPEFRGW